MLIMCIMNLEAIVYENAEDESISKWKITDSSPANAKVKNIIDETINSRVIELKGAGYDNEYTVGGHIDTNSAWKESSQLYLTFSINSKDGFFLDVILETTKGLRYLRYRDDDTNLGIDDEYTNIGLGYDAANGEWHEFTQDLSADLKIFDPSNKIIAVHGLQIRGDCKVDNIELSNKKPSGKDLFVFENAEDGKVNRWTIIDNPAATAKVNNVLDSELNSKVIKLQGLDSYANQYGFTFTKNNRKNLNLKWDMKTKEGFTVDILVNTSLGERLLRYKDEPESTKGIDQDTIFYGLTYSSTNGLWHTYRRDLQKDLEAFEVNNKVLSVKKFLIRANCSLDNIELFVSPSKIYEDAEDGKISRWKVYGDTSNAIISNKYDAGLKSKVISLKGASYNNEYIIGGDLYDDNGWNDSRHTHIKWSMKNSDGYVVSLMLKTKKGNRYLEYIEAPFTEKSQNGESISYGLGYASTDGLWHTYIRDIALDLKGVEADNELLSIEGMVIIGSVEIDDLELFKIHQPSKHAAGFALTFDDNYVNDWFSMREVFLEYGMKPTFFVSSFNELTTAHIKKLKTLEQDGAEIGCHTYNHAGVKTDFKNNVNLIDQYINEQIIPILNEMNAAGFKPKSFAYPFGEHEVNYDNAVRAYFPYLRRTVSDKNRKLYQIDEIFHKKGKNYNILAGDGIDNSYGNKLDEIKEAFIKASKNGEIITFYAHRVIDNPADLYAISPKKLEKVIQYSKELGLKSYTFKEAYLISK